MRIKNIHLINKELITSLGSATFNSEGIAEVAEEIGNALLELDGYSDADNEATEPEVVNLENKVVEEVPVEETPSEPENDEEEAKEEESDNLEEELSKMNVPQLKKYAKDNNIELNDASKKDEIISMILGAAN